VIPRRPSVEEKRLRNITLLHHLRGDPGCGFLLDRTWSRRGWPRRFHIFTPVRRRAQA
jgi:hypothetical protein